MIEKMIVQTIKSTVKNNKRLKEYRKKAQGIIDRGIKAGHEENMKKHLGSLDVNKLVKSKKGLEKLKNDMKYIRQIPQIEKDVEAYNRKVERNKLIKEANAISKAQINELRNTYGQRAISTMRRDRTYKKISLFVDYKDKKNSADDLRQMIHEMKTVSGVTHYKSMMRVEIDDFFDDYFREVRLNDKYKGMLEDMKDHFAETDALSDFYDFCDYISSNDFKGKYYPDKSDVDEYEAMMVDRLHRAMDAMINNTYK